MEFVLQFYILLTGVVVECQTDRSQIKNRKIALQKLRAIIYKKQLEQQQSLTRSVRKQQVNFPTQHSFIFLKL